MPRARGYVTAALAAALLVVMGFLAAPVLAQDGNQTGEGNGEAPGEGFTRTLTIGALEGTCPGGQPQCWDTELLVARPGDTVILIADLRGTAETHNIDVLTPIGQKTPPSTGEVHRVEFTFPQDVASIRYICDVHPTTMVGTLVTPAEAARLAAAGAHEEVHELGVHFLAYWVGIIAFAILFLVYGITFFLFKYNETSATTDHWDRSGEAAPGGKRMGGGAASLLAVVIAVAALAAIIWFARAG